MSLHIFRQYYHTVLMYGILQLNTFPSGNILRFVRSFHEMDWYTYKSVTNAFSGLTFEKYATNVLNARASVSMDTKLYTWNIRKYYIKYFPARPYCALRAWIGSLLNNFIQKILLRLWTEPRLHLLVFNFAIRLGSSCWYWSIVLNFIGKLPSHSSSILLISDIISVV